MALSWLLLLIAMGYIAPIVLAGGRQSHAAPDIALAQTATEIQQQPRDAPPAGVPPVTHAGHRWPGRRRATTTRKAVTMRKHMEERRATDDFCLKSDRDEEELMRTYSSLRRGVLSVLAVLVASLTLGAGAVSAAEPVHVKLTFGPDTFDAPAGTLGFCDFDYHEESSGTVNIKRFFDKDGNLVRVEAQVDLFVLHRNVDTGLTLTERVRFAAHIDLVTGERTVTGQNWHLRDENGRLVLSGAGLVGIDLIAGEIIKETPHFRADFAQTNCTALGGAPAT